MGLLTDAALRIARIYLLSPDIAAAVSQALMVTAYTLLVAYTIYTAKQRSAVAPADSVSPTVIVTDQAVPAAEGPGVRDESTEDILPQV
jgi:hypothetical protein